MKRKLTIWMTIYADLMTTLMFFFLAAWAVTRMDTDVQMKVSNAFKMRITGEKFQDLKKDLALGIKEEKQTNGYSKIEISEQRVKITLSDYVMFESGSSALSEKMCHTLDEVSEVLMKNNQPIVVEGYTDDIPVINGSNWELSLSRAISVVEYLVREDGIPRNRFMVAGYGEYKPLVPNTTPENRRKNRRIEITVLRYG